MTAELLCEVVMLLWLNNTMNLEIVADRNNMNELIAVRNIPETCMVCSISLKEEKRKIISFMKMFQF